MERTPLLGAQTTGVSGIPGDYEKPVQSLRYYWPCLSTGICLNTLAVCASVWLTKSILDVPTRATYFQTNWWIVWLVALLVIVGACAAGVRSKRCAAPLRLRLNPRRRRRRAARHAASAPRPPTRR